MPNKVYDIVVVIYPCVMSQSVHAVHLHRVYMLYTCTVPRYTDSLAECEAANSITEQLALLIAGQAFSLHSKVLTTQVHDVETEKNKFVCIPLHTVVAICTDFFNIFSTDTSKLGSVKCGDF